MIEKAVIDRYEEDLAILLVGDMERKIVVPRKNLPAGATEGRWLKVELDGEKLVSAIIDEQETAKARQRITDKLQQLRKGDHLK